MIKKFCIFLYFSLSGAINCLICIFSYLKSIDKEKKGMTALILACFKGKEQVALLLIEKGANIHIQSRDRRNALQHAKIRGLDKVMKVLKSKGAFLPKQPEKKIRSEGYPSQPATLTKTEKRKVTKNLKTSRIPFSRASKFCELLQKMHEVTRVP